MSNSASLVLIEEAEPGIIVVTMNRPRKLNPLSRAMVDQLHTAFDDIASSQTVRAMVLTGAGRGFSSGADLTDGGAVGDGPTIDVGLAFALQERIASLHEKIHRLKTPVVAAVNGPAVGGGFSLTLASDIRVAAQSARFGAVFINLGISACDMGTSYFLPRLIGASRAAELMLTGRIFAAAEAEKIGLVSDVVEDGAVVDRAIDLCRHIATHVPMAVWMTKETMWQNLDAPSLRSALDLENRTQVLCSQGPDVLEATRAFAKRRAGDPVPSPSRASRNDVQPTA